MSGNAEIQDEVAAIYDKYFEKVFSYCAFRLYSKELAEDATAAVFVRLVTHYETLRTKDADYIPKWLYGTASNVVRKHLREARRRRETLPRIAREGQTHQTDQNGHIDWPVLYDGLSKLRPRDQHLITLRFFEGLATATMAKILGMNHGTVRVLLSRALKKLRRELEKNFAEA